MLLNSVLVLWPKQTCVNSADRSHVSSLHICSQPLSSNGVLSPRCLSQAHCSYLAWPEWNGRAGRKKTHMNTFNKRDVPGVQRVSGAGLSIGYSSTVPAFLILTGRYSPVPFAYLDSKCRRGNKVFRKWLLGEGLKKTEGGDAESSKMTQVSSWGWTLRAWETYQNSLWGCLWVQPDLHSEIPSLINKGKPNQIIKPHQKKPNPVYLQRSGRKRQDWGGLIMTEQFCISHNCSGLLKWCFKTRSFILKLNESPEVIFSWTWPHVPGLLLLWLILLEASVSLW